MNALLGDFCIIGGSPEERLIYATKCRRLGFSVHIETHQAKRRSARKRAVEASRWGAGGVYDLDNEQDRAWLDQDGARLAQRGL